MLGGYNDAATNAPLRDYQLHGVQWGLDRLFVQQALGAGLFFDPGLGKTRTTATIIDTLLHYGEIEKVLIVAPLRPLYNVWPDEFERWGFEFDYSILHQRHAAGLEQNCKVELVNYEGLVKLKDIRKRWDLIVLDESSYVKNWSAKRSKTLRAMLPTIPRRMILNGSPASNCLSDVHAQIYVLDNGEALGKTVTNFRSNYMTKGGFMGRQWILRDDRKAELLERMAPLVLRLQAEDWLDMPQLLINDIWCQLPPGSVRKYNQLKRELFAQLETGDIFATSAGGAYQKCKQFANGTVYATQEDGTKESHRAHDEKILALVHLFEELQGKPLLIFYDYTQDLNRIQAHPQFRNAAVIRGGMALKTLKPILAQWNAGQLPVLLAQWRAASHGLNMQGACNDLACFGVPDSLDTYDQAYRRVYRQGVTGDQVRIHRLLTRKTVDELMVARLAGKFQTQDEFLQALKTHAKNGT